MAPNLWSCSGFLAQSLWGQQMERKAARAREEMACLGSSRANSRSWSPSPTQPLVDLERGQQEAGHPGASPGGLLAPAPCPSF